MLDGLDNAHVEGADFEEPTPEEIAAAAAEFEAAQLDDGSLLVDRDPDSGAVEKLHFGNDGSFTLERVVDVEPVLDWCKSRYNEGLANRLCEFRQIASLPPEALDTWARLNRPGLPPGWYLKKEYHSLVIEAAHDRDLSGFRTLAGEYRRRGEGT